MIYPLEILIKTFALEDKDNKYIDISCNAHDTCLE